MNQQDTRTSRRDLGSAVAGLAEQRYGVITTRQLRGLGLSDTMVSGWVATGRLHRIHRSVFAVGHRDLSDRGKWLAATDAAAAILSHGSAAALWNIGSESPGPPSVTVSRNGPRRRPGLAVHRISLAAGDHTVRARIPVTTPARTILDQAADLDQLHLEQMISEARYLGLVSLPDLRSRAAVGSGRTGVGKLRVVLDYENAGRARTRSALERRFLALCRAAALPDPLVNQRVHDIEVDFSWPQQRVIVETDGFDAHRTRAQFERDHRRVAALRGHGWSVIRFTHDQVTRSPDAVVADVARELGFGA